jgi:hypothetical protein
MLVIASFTFFTAMYKEGAPASAFSVLALTQSFVLIDIWLGHKNISTNLNKLCSPVFLAAFLMPFILQYIIVSVPMISSVFKTQSVSFIIFGSYVVLSSFILSGIFGVKGMFETNS